METEKADGPRPVSVVSTTSDGIRLLTVAGELDHQTSQPLQQALEHRTPDTAPRVVIDMRQLTFMDSSGINTLIAAHRTLTEAGGWLRLAGLTEPVVRVVQLVGIDALIPCHPTVEAALAP